MKVTLLIPTLNEIGGMKQIMPRIKKEWYDQLIILDGGSTDGTVEYARNNGYFVYVQKTKGLKRGCDEVFDLIEGNVIITFSPDGNSIPELIPPLIEKMKEGYDMVIVSRYAKGARSHDDDLATAFGNRMFTVLINLLFGGHYTDTLVIFRTYKKKIIESLEINKKLSFLERAQAAGIIVGWELQLSIRCAKRKLKVAEIPGDEPARISGKRKMQPARAGLVILTQIIYDFFFWR